MLSSLAPRWRRPFIPEPKPSQYLLVRKHLISSGLLGLMGLLSRLIGPLSFLISSNNSVLYSSASCRFYSVPLTQEMTTSAYNYNRCIHFFGRLHVPYWFFFSSFFFVIQIENRVHYLFWFPIIFTIIIVVSFPPSPFLFLIIYIPLSANILSLPIKHLVPLCIVHGSRLIRRLLFIVPCDSHIMPYTDIVFPHLLISTVPYHHIYTLQRSSTPHFTFSNPYANIFFFLSSCFSGFSLIAFLFSY